MSTASLRSHAASVDPLPPSARARMIALEGAATDARDAAQSAQRRLSHLRGALSADNPDHAASVEVELARLVAARERHDARYRELAALVATLSDWVARLPPGTRLISARLPAAKRQGNETLPQAIARVRREIAETQQQLRAAQTAKSPKSDLKAAAREKVEQMVVRGRPGVSSVAGGGLSVAFRDEKSFNGPSNEYVACMIAWLHPDAVRAKLEAEIDAMPELTLALTTAEREQRVSDLNAALDQMERLEESLIEQAEAEGQEVLRRPLASPLAVLRASRR